MKELLCFAALSLVASCSAQGSNSERKTTTPTFPEADASDSDVSTPIVHFDAGPSLEIDAGPGSGVSEDGPVPNCAENCQDFPAEPIFAEASAKPIPANAPELFGAPDRMTATGPCVLEPQLAIAGEPGTLFPANWLRPRFRFEPLEGEDLWEIRLQTAKEANSLVVYTTAPSWTMPATIWKALANNVHNEAINVTIRGLNSASPGTPSGTRGSFQIAPVYAGGSLVYWETTSQQINPTTSKLVGFRVGDEGVVDALTIPQVGNRGVIDPEGKALRVTPDPQASKVPGDVQCIGCHVSTPDGKAVAFTDLWPWNNLLASIEKETAGALPPYVTPGAARLLNQPHLGMQSMTKQYFSETERILITSYAQRSTTPTGAPIEGFGLHAQGKEKLAWFNLAANVEVPWTEGDSEGLNQAVQNAQGSAWGFLNLEGETRSAVTPSFSHDAQKIAYTSVDNAQDGRIGANNQNVDIHVVPYAARAGGAIVPLEGAAQAGAAEYYPAFSADDAFVAFNRVANIDANAMYYRADGEVWVVPAAGGTATRLAANDPPACTGQKSPGVINSWPKWSPHVVANNGKSYYWLIFSSGRRYDGQFELPATPYSPPDRRSSQLYMTGVVRDNATGELTTYAGVYLWNQNPKATNLTPAWEEFKIPPVPPPK